MSKLENKSDEQFCHEYLIDLNADRAYCTVQDCETSDATRAAASRLIKKATVKNRISELIERREKRTDKKADDVLRFLDDALNFDLIEWLEFGDKGMTFNNLSKMPKELRRLVTSVKQTYAKDHGIVLNVTFVNKEKIVDLLTRHHGLITDKTEITVAEKTLEQLIDEGE